MNSDGATLGFGSHSAIPPTGAEAHKAAADLLFEQGKLGEAIDAYLRAIDANPESFIACGALGDALQSDGRFEEALAAYREGLVVNPDALEIHAAMASLLARMGRIDEALAAQARAASINSNAALTQQALGEIMLQKRDPKSAVESFRRALAIDPKLHAAWNFLGVALVSLGRFDEAADCFRRFLALRPDSAIGYSNLVNTGRFVGGPEINRLTQLLNKPDLPVDERIPAGFALGKLLDDADRYDDAFARYAQANGLVKARRAAAAEEFDPRAFRDQIQQMVEIFTPDFFASRRHWGDPSELPVFIVGMPRSGTTLVQQIAASHPLVHGAGELHDIIGIASGFGGTDLKNAALGWTPDAVHEAAKRHLRKLQDVNVAAARVIDKMPSNVYRVALIALLFPAARVIQCRRDARDVCLSCYFQWFANGNLFSYDLANCAHEYLATERMLDHWRDTAPLRILDVQYEALVADLEGQSRRLISFLGLPWDSACLEFHRARSAVLTSSVWQVRQPIYQRSVGRWKHYERHLGPLNEVLGQRF